MSYLTSITRSFIQSGRIASSSGPRFPTSRSSYVITHIFTLLIAGSNDVLVVFVRIGVKEMLEHLSEFCNLYIYSHGMKTYIMEVLKNIDPLEKYFKDRERRVLAPKDGVEQSTFVNKGKSVKDFCSDIEESDWLIIDDQLGVIKEKGKDFK